MMNNLNSLRKSSELVDGIKCNTECTEFDEGFDLVRERHPEFEHGHCQDGVCSIVWKPQRQSAA
jgi:hypothetical protein